MCKIFYLLKQSYKKNHINKWNFENVKFNSVNEPKLIRIW